MNTFPLKSGTVVEAASVQFHDAQTKHLFQQVYFDNLRCKMSMKEIYEYTLFYLEKIEYMMASCLHSPLSIRLILYF